MQRLLQGLSGFARNLAAENFFGQLIIGVNFAAVLFLELNSEFLGGQRSKGLAHRGLAAGAADEPGLLGINKGIIRRLFPVGLGNIVHVDAGNLIIFTKTLQRAEHALAGAEFVNIAVFHHDFSLGAGVLRDPHVAGVALIFVSDRQSAVGSLNGTDSNKRSQCGNNCVLHNFLLFFYVNGALLFGVKDVLSVSHLTGVLHLLGALNSRLFYAI